MSLATRCIACGTVFRVVQDQLKVSEGWVRCGRCGDVFSALEGLFDLERETAPNWTPSQRGTLDLLPASADDHERQTSLGATPLAGSDATTQTSLLADATDGVGDTEVDTRADSQIDTQQPEPGTTKDDAVARGQEAVLDGAAIDAAGVEPAALELSPAFMRRADRAARWQSPGMQRTLALAAAVLGLLLAAQAALWQRDAIAARWPPAAPLLARLCEPLGCRLEPLRYLNGLAVESSGLIQLDNPSLYRLQVELRNRDARPLLAPALDLTLTDSRGAVVARKVLGPREWGSATPTIVAAGTELTLQAVLESGERRITGYSIEIFYP